MDGQAHQKQLTFGEHVQELRRRLTWPALAFIVSAVIGYVFNAAIITFLKQPLHQTLYYTTPAGNFNFIMKVCTIFGVTVAIPMLIYSLVAFIEPAIKKRLRRRSIVKLSLLSLGLGIAGAVFAYYIVVPMSLHFFGDFKISGINPLITADEYLNFILTCILSFILMFQLPLLILFINKITPLKPRKLLRYERHVIVGALVIALVLPFTYDPLTQFLIAVPIILLFNLSVMLVWLANRRRPAKRKLPAKQFNIVNPVKPVALSPIGKPKFAPKPQVAAAVTKGRTVVRRPILDVAGGATPRRDFLDLRPSTRPKLDRVQ